MFEPEDEFWLTEAHVEDCLCDAQIVDALCVALEKEITQ